MGEQTQALAERFEAVNREAITLAESLTAQQWQQVCPGEGWTVGVALHHIAVSYTGIADWVVRLAQQKPVRTSHDQINDINEKHAAEQDGYTREVTLALLQANGGVAAHAVRHLEDAQLDNSAPFLPAGVGKERSCRQVIEHVLIGHPQGHLQSIRQALGLGGASTTQAPA
jgi:hypothetical protein